ncbi:DUF4179 domain-containing protein [Paenibacillus solani]|uniref:Uncharacterized protein n=1 Tax=Paenibacillus solani TaxID=1705565 RepID=A0A0M1P3R4_9BACL|nr:DUF4179 domain-containing protein [Paenibacillus solani]KOR89126.1 hypothetical protein AM231_08100 [Paenibacillus solani]
MLDKEYELMKDSTVLNEKANSLPESKLSAAVREGMEQGRKRERRRMYSVGMGTLATLTAMVLLLVIVNRSPFTEIQDRHVQTSSISSVNSLELFPSELLRDSSLKKALEGGLVKPINLITEKNGYGVELLGAVTDGRKAYVVFNVINNKEVDIILRDFSLEFGGYLAPSFGARFDILSGSGQISAGQSSYYVYSTDLLPSDPYTNDAKIRISLSDTSTQALNSTSKKYVTSMDISLQLEPNMFKDKERVYSPNRTLKVDGQKINVRQLLFTPLNTYADLEYDQTNEKQIYKLLNPVLIGKRGEHVEKLYYPQSTLRDDSKVTLVYKSSQLDQLGTLSLKTFGIAAVNKDKLRIVVDLNKKQIVEAPDDYLQMVISDQQSGVGEVHFQRKLENAHAAESFGMWLEDSFTDASGVKHSRSSEGFGQSVLATSVKDDTMEDSTSYNFGKEAVNYPQPLTIKVKQYWIPIKDTQAVELLSE